MQMRNTMDAVYMYLEEQNISYMQILRDTKIDISSKQTLKASDFLKLCDYLRVRPEEFMNMAEDMGDGSVSL